MFGDVVEAALGPDESADLIRAQLRTLSDEQKMAQEHA
jgi:hypothetical protein